MSQTIDNRIVEMQFENKQFESGVQESLSTLDKLKNALKFDDASKNLTDFSKNINKNIDLSGLSKSVEDVGSKFSASGIAGMEVIRRLTDFAIEAGKTIASALDAPFRQIREGGWKRAMNIEDAKFQLKGLDVAWESVSEDINYAVADTAFGLDAAAKACAQLSASGIQAGKDMKTALRGISGVAAMGNTEYENITDIFTKAAGNGKVMAQELNRISQYGLNARAEVVKFFNDINSGAEKVERLEIPEYIQKNVKSLTKGAQMAESELSEFVRKGKLDFETFAYAMDYAFGEHAKAANETFMGSLRNIKAALSKIGAEFATPIIQGAVPVFNQIRIFLNDLRKQMGPVFTAFKNLAELVSNKLTTKLEQFRHAFFDLGALEHIGNAVKNVFTNILKVISAIKNAFDTVFPSTRSFTRSIVDVAKGIEHLTDKLVISDGALMMFRNVMVVVFNILKAIGTVIKNILPIVGKVASAALKIVNVIVTLVAYLTTFIMKLDLVKNALASIQKAGGLFAFAIEKIKSAFANLKDILTDTSTVTGQVFMKLKDSAMTVAYVVGGSLYLAFSKLREMFTYFNTHDPLGSILDSINRLKNIPAINSLVTGIENAVGAVIITLGKAIDAVVTFVKEIQNGKNIFEAFGTVAESAIAGIISAFNKLKDTVSNWFSIFDGGEKVIEETIEAPVYGATNAFVGFEKELSMTQGEVNKTTSAFDKAKGSIIGFGAVMLDKIKNLNASKVILAAYAGMLLVIAYNANELLKAMGKLSRTLSGGFLSVFRAPTTRVDKFKTAILSITGAIAALGTVIYMLKDVPTEKLDQITNSLLKLIGLTGGLSLLATLITEFMVRFGGGNGFNVFSSNMFMLAAGVGAMVLSLKVLETINMSGKELWEKIAVIAALSLALTTFSTIMAKVAPQLTLGSIFMIAFAASVLILVKALDNLSRINLKGINENWKELSVIIVSFAAFAALAGTVGVSSVFSLVAFLIGLSTLLSHMEEIKKTLNDYGVGEMIATFFVKLKDGIVKAVSYAATIYFNMSTLDKTLLGITALLGGAGITALLVGMGYAAKHVKKAAVSATIFAVAVAGLMYATYKIAEACKSIPAGDIGNAIAILSTVGILLGAVITLAGLFGGDSTSQEFESGGKGLLGKDKRLIKSKNATNKSQYLKEARKLLLDMGVLLASVALFCSVVGKLTPSELEQARWLLLQVSLLFGGLMVVIALISSHARSTASSAASIIPFIGIIAVIGSLIGAFVVLMNYLKDFSWKDQWGELVAALAVLATVVTAVILFLKRVSTIRKAGGGWKSIAAFSAVILALGNVIYALMDVIKTPEDLNMAKNIAIGIGIFLTALVALTLILEGATRAILTTTKRQSAFTRAIVALGVMIAAIGALAGTFLLLKDIGAWQMAKQAAVIIGVLAAISALVMAIQHFSKDSLTSITKTSGPKLKQTMAMIGMFFLAFEALALTFYGLRNVNSDNMAAQMLSIVIALTALTALGLAVQHFTKKVGSDWATMGKAAAMLGGMAALFTALALVFKYIVSDIKTEGIIAKSQTIVLVILELEVLAAAAGVLGTFAGDIALGELTLLGMVALFGVLSLAFIGLDMIKTEGIMAKSQTIILVLLELEVLAALCGVLGALSPEIALGELTLLGMVAMFGVLSLVFIVISKLNPEKLMGKSQTMVLVLLELEGLLALLGVLSPLALLALAGIPGILAVTLALVGIAGAIRLLGDMDLGRIQGTVDILINTLQKIMEIGAAGIVSGAGLLAVAAGIGALAVACGAAGVAIEVLAAAVVKLTATGPSILAWFTSISVGVTNLSISIMNSITGLSKSVVAAVNNLITGVIAAIASGGAMIFAAAVALGQKMKDGFESIIKPQIWGADLVKNFANGIMSNLGPIISAVTAVANVIHRYLHFTSPDVGPASDFDKYAPDMMATFGNGIISNMNLITNPLNSIGENIHNVLGNIDVSNIGQKIASTIGQGLFDGSGTILQWKSWLDSLLTGEASRIEQINAAVGRGATTREAAVTKSLAAEQKLEKQIQAQTNAMNENIKYMKRGGAAVKDVEKYQTQCAAKIKKTTEELESQRTETDKLAGIYVEAASSADDFGKSLGGVGDGGKKAAKGTKEAKDAVADFYDMVQGAISLFDKYEEAEQMSSDELLSNMASQISGIANWSTKIQQLSAKGIEQGLLQKLAEMGPQGEKYVNAFVNMTAEQLQQANKYYEQSLMLPEHVTAQVFGSYAIAGNQAATGFIYGLDMEHLKDNGVTFAKNFLSGVEDFLQIKSPSRKMKEEGSYTTQGFTAGIKDPSAQESLMYTITSMCRDVITKFRLGLPASDFKDIGQQILRGLNNGINSKDPDVLSSISNLSVSCINKARSIFQIKSPSRVFSKIGEYITLGLAKGITNNTSNAIEAMSTTADEIIDTMRDTLNKANQALIDDVDEPVITPILDLSQIQSGSRELDNMLSRNEALSAGTSFTNLQNEQWNGQSALLNATMDNSDVVGAIGTLQEEILSLKDAMTNIKMVLDTGTMVGAMTPAIDQQLGMRQVYAGRGI